MILRLPATYRAALPPGHWWVICENDHGDLVIVLSDLVPAGGRLERQLRRAAVRAWRRDSRAALPAGLALPAAWTRRKTARLRAAVSPLAAVMMAGAVAASAGVLVLDLSTGGGNSTESVSAPQPPTVSAPPATPAPARPAPRPPASPPERRPGRSSPGTGGTPAWTVSLPSHAGPRPHKTHKAHNAKPPAHPGHRPPGSGRHHPPGGGPPPRPPSWFLRDRGVHAALRLPGASAHIHAGVPCWRLLRLHARIGSLAGLHACL